MTFSGMTCCLPLISPVAVAVTRVFWRMAGGDLDEGDPVFCLDFGVGGGVADDESERACEEIGCKAGEGG